MTYAESFSSTYLTRYITLALVRSSSSGSRKNGSCNLLDSDPTLDTTYSETICCGEAGDDSGLPFQW